MTDAQRNFIEKLAGEHSSGILCQQYFIAGATDPRIAEMWRAEGAALAFEEAVRTCAFYSPGDPITIVFEAKARRERIAALMDEKE